MACEKSQDKRYATRKSPPYPANQCPEGDRRKGNDGQWWVAVRASNGVNRWVRQPVAKPGPLVKKTGHDLSAMTVAGLKAHLKKMGIAFPSGAKKADLIKMVEKHRGAVTHSSSKWYDGRISAQKLKQVIGFEAVSEKDVTAKEVLDNYQSEQQYQKAKRGEDAMAGWQIIGKKSKYYLQEYPVLRKE